jgi:hypothetical protein
MWGAMHPEVHGACLQTCDYGPVVAPTKFEMTNEAMA